MNPRNRAAALVAGAGLQFFLHPAWAEDTLHGVVVSATRVEQRLQDTLADVTVIGREQIESAGQSTLSDLLARQPGIQMNSNGGPGTSTNYYIRGAESNQSVVLIDGMRVGSASSGTAALQYLPLSQIERIEIVRGPASAVYGADAIGGVIQIFTRKGGDGLHFDAFAGAGSFGTVDSRVGLRGGNDLLSFSLAGGIYRTRGFNATNPARGSNYNPDRDGYLNRNVSGNVRLTPASGTELGVSLLHGEGRSDYDAGAGFPDTRNDFSNTTASAYLTQQWTDAFSTTLRVGRSIDDFTSFSSKARPYGDDFRTEQDSYVLEARLLTSVGTVFGSVEKLTQDLLTANNGGRIAGIDGRRDIDSAQLGWSGEFGRLGLQANARHDSYSGGRSKATGNVAAGYRITDAWRVRAGYGTAFRLPTFNELYFPGFGNPDVQPESSRNREIGLVWQGRGRRASVTAYDNRVQNLIAGFPVANAASARLKGATFEASAYVFGHTEVQASYDVLSAIDEDSGNRLRRRAAQAATLMIQQHAGAGRIGIEWQASGDCYDDSANLKRLPGYLVVNLFAVWNATPEVAVEARINNMMDREYSTVLGYETAGANGFVGVRYTPGR